MNRATPRLILGSTSRYRADLLRRLGIDFTQCAPQIDEAELAAESAPTRALRLAIAKAEAAAREQDNAVVVGSDQVAALGRTILHKPGNVETACAQLRASSSQAVTFHTTALEVSVPRRWASLCSRASKATIRPRSSACR